MVLLSFALGDQISAGTFFHYLCNRGILKGRL